MKRYLPAVVIVVLLISAGTYMYTRSAAPGTSSGSTVSSTVKFVSSAITADGSVVAQDQARLSFQTSGKLVYLPFKEGDRVRAGQIIARLDTYALQRQLSAALNNYKSARDTFDQTAQNGQDNVLKSQISSSYTQANQDFNSVVNDALKRILDQNQNSLDNSVINVELANYALQLSTLTSPVSGVITHEDVSVSGLNITPATGFTVADPDTAVFRANVPASYIYYVSLGSSVDLVIDGLPNRLSGTVSRIYPAKVTLANGQSAYQVDIVSDDLKSVAKLDQSGQAIISTNSAHVALVPVWTVLDGKYIWINNTGTPELKQVQVGKIHNNEMEIISGLSPGDRILVNPRYITSEKYPIL